MVFKGIIQNILISRWSINRLKNLGDTYIFSKYNIMRIIMWLDIAPPSGLKPQWSLASFVNLDLYIKNLD